MINCIRIKLKLINFLQNKKKEKNVKIVEIISFHMISYLMELNIKYVRCNHINGMYEESSNFLNYLYRDDPNSNYTKTYLKNYEERVNKIYLPKAKFLKSN